MSTVVVDQTEPAEEASFTSRNLLAYVPGVLLLIVSLGLVLLTSRGLHWGVGAG
jgi:hypothetical protein